MEYLAILNTVGAGLLILLLADDLSLRWKLHSAMILPRSTVFNLVDAVRWAEFVSSSIPVREASRSASRGALDRLRTIYNDMIKLVPPVNILLGGTDRLLNFKHKRLLLRKTIQGLEKEYADVDQMFQRCIKSYCKQAKSTLAHPTLLPYSSIPYQSLEEAQTMLADQDAKLVQDIRDLEETWTSYYANVHHELGEPQKVQADDVNQSIDNVDLGKRAMDRGHADKHDTDKLVLKEDDTQKVVTNNDPTEKDNTDREVITEDVTKEKVSEIKITEETIADEGLLTISMNSAEALHLKEFFRLSLMLTSKYHSPHSTTAAEAISIAGERLDYLFQRNLALESRTSSHNQAQGSGQFLKVHQNILRQALNNVDQLRAHHQSMGKSLISMLSESIELVSQIPGFFATMAQDINTPAHDVWLGNGLKAMEQYERTEKIILDSCKEKGLHYYDEPKAENSGTTDEGKTKPADAPPNSEANLKGRLQKLKKELITLREAVPEGLRAYEENLIVTQIEDVYNKLGLGEVPCDLQRGYISCGSVNNQWDSMPQMNLFERRYWRGGGQ